MKVFISADIEGVAGVVHREHTARDGREHDRARVLMTEEVNSCIEGALSWGATEVVVNDSHGTMRILIPEAIHPEAEYITGSPKMLAMMEGISPEFDAAIFLGYHSRMGNLGILNHTFHGGVIRNIRINHQDMGEIALNAGIAGVFGVPVVLVTGCQYAAKEALDFIPEIETAVVKHTINRQTAKNLSPQKARCLIKEKTIASLSCLPKIQSVSLQGPFLVEITYLHPGLADAAEILPIVERVNSTTHRFETDDFIIAFRNIRSLIAIAGGLN
ncbi:M55 family metallopeptidase [Bacillus sp. ISL-4]|uniref:M55 family metallopeptidase n=1 Tax=Bacillus sp. ISL-4 TaxID=2819125 RepID=UPI001BE92577|nr:M55 family metallopeptidase [Bacillus sp. ISL-4]MBT2666669.1 M55 family metallopeptidase [Bacillus sp. ISL-4]MBT2672491.1 M55 family metallopeptidase [Streptomyces sp. ISL-14]